MDKYDSIWKEIIENLFKQFVYFFLPDLAGDMILKRNMNSWIKNWKLYHLNQVKVKDMPINL